MKYENKQRKTILTHRKKTEKMHLLGFDGRLLQHSFYNDEEKK
jgi:hypothetical protein